MSWFQRGGRCGWILCRMLVLLCCRSRGCSRTRRPRDAWLSQLYRALQRIQRANLQFFARFRDRFRGHKRHPAHRRLWVWSKFYLANGMDRINMHTIKTSKEHDSATTFHYTLYLRPVRLKNVCRIYTCALFQNSQSVNAAGRILYARTRPCLRCLRIPRTNTRIYGCVGGRRRSA